MNQQQTRIKKVNLQQNEYSRDIHSNFQEDSQNSLRVAPASRKGETIQKERNMNRAIHSEFTEHSQQLLGALNIGKLRVQGMDQINGHQIPLTGYENFHQELQTYPVSREPMMVQLTGADNVSSSVLLDLPNINTNLPPPLIPNPSPHQS